MHTLQLKGPIILCVPAIGISAFLALMFVHEFFTIAIIGDTELYPFGTPDIYFWRTESIYIWHTLVVSITACAILVYSIRAARKQTMRATVYALAMTILFVVALVADAHLVQWLR